MGKNAQFTEPTCALFETTEGNVPVLTIAGENRVNSADLQEVFADAERAVTKTEENTETAVHDLSGLAGAVNYDLELAEKAALIAARKAVEDAA